MLHQLKNQLLPGGVIARLHDVLVNDREQQFGLEGDRQQRGGAGAQDQVDGLVQRVEMVMARGRQQIEVLLNEQPDHARMQGAHLGLALLPHRIGGETALAERDAIDLQRPLRPVQEQADGDAARLGRDRGGDEQRQAEDAAHVASHC